MRKYLFLILCICSSIAYSRPIDVKQAKERAESFFDGLGKKHSQLVELQIPNSEKKRNGAKKDIKNLSCAYIFNNIEEPGFVIMGADDVLPEILGYSTSSTFNVDEMPDELIRYLESLDGYVAKCSSENFTPAKSHRNAPYKVIEPLITSSWGQREPYNTLCPENCPVGCVSTAASQIMYYWKWPLQGRGSNSYQYGGSLATKLEVNFEDSFYDWANMSDVASISSSTETKNAVAKLSYDCGVAVNMIYSPEGSGSYDEDIKSALVNHFRYKASTIDIKRRACYAEQADWDALIYQELIEGRPVLMSASSLVGSGSDAAGHMFVLDGIDSNGLVHMNWGWDGSANGYYAISLPNPNGFQFSLSQAVIVGIHPDYEGNDADVKQLRLYIKSNGGISTAWKSRKLDTSLAINVTSIYNHSSKPSFYRIGLGLFDMDGNLCQIIGSNVDEPEFMEAWSGHSILAINAIVKSEWNLPEGEYMTRVVSQQKGFDTWELPDIEAGSTSMNILPTYISDGKVYFKDAPAGIEETTASVHVTSKFYTMNGVELRGFSHKQGVIIKKDIYADGTMSSSKFIMK